MSTLGGPTTTTIPLPLRCYFFGRCTLGCRGFLVSGTSGTGVFAAFLTRRSKSVRCGTGIPWSFGVCCVDFFGMIAVYSMHPRRTDK